MYKGVKRTSEPIRQLRLAAGNANIYYRAWPELY